MLNVKLVWELNLEGGYNSIDISYESEWGHKPEVGDKIETGLIHWELDEATIKSVTYSPNGNCTATLEPVFVRESTAESLKDYSRGWDVKCYD